jgi:hypothetical protein
MIGIGEVRQAEGTLISKRQKSFRGGKIKRKNKIKMQMSRIAES